MASQAGDFSSRVGLWEGLSFAAELSVTVLSLGSLVVLCCSMDKQSSPACGLFNGVFSLALMLLFAGLIALTHFRLLYFLDFCESTIASTEQALKPQHGSGLAMYLSCLPQDQLSYAAQLGYRLTREQEKVIILANQQLAALNVTPSVAGISDI